MCAYSRNIQPDFWLEIRKEYIIENFEKLLYYIRNYKYDKNKDSGNGEFLTTCRYLLELAHELSEYSYNRSFISTPEFKLSSSEITIQDAMAYRIMVAAIISSQKIGKDEHILIARLINLLVISHKMPQTDIAEDLINVISNCVRKSAIKTLGISWNDIEDPCDFRPISLLHNLSRTKFDSSTGEDCVFEGKGTVKFCENMVQAAPVNKIDFLKNYNLTEYISIGKNLRILLPKSDHMKCPENVEEIADGMTFITRVQGTVKASPSESKKKYTPGSIIPVVIKSRYGVKVEAETYQQQYNQIEGKVNINLQETLKYADIFRILDFLKEGTVLFAEYTPDDPEFCFQLRMAFNEFYNEFANDMRWENLMGVYVGDYSAGTQWLTYEGFLVNVMGKVTDNDISHAMEENIPLSIRLNGTKMTNATVLVNGRIVDDLEIYGFEEPIDDLETYKHDCFKYIFQEFLSYCNDNAPVIETNSKINDINGNSLLIIGNILTEHQRMLSATMPRLKCLQAALILSIAAGDEIISAYIRHELEYQIALAKFAGGASPMSISLSHGSALDGIEEVEKHERIISMIRNYKEPEIGHPFERITNDENIEDTVDGLIDASNRLIGKIDDREISRIKLELARSLDVDDQYKSPDHSTYYGVESDTLEFKISAVCPPKNKLKGFSEYEPETQKWAILKTICGFLNSTTGGDLLIGVRDNGLAAGISPVIY